MPITVSTRTTCRICGGSDLRRFFRHERAPFTDEFVTAETAGSEFLHDVDVHWCAGCGTAQTLHDVDVTGYYRDYGYTVSGSSFATSFMEAAAEASCARFGLRPGDSVIEVGSGDGAQLLAFQQRGLRVLGVEPSDPLCAASRAAGVPVAQILFGPDSVDELPREALPAQAVLLSYTFDHLPDPVGFLAAAREVLDPERGVLLIEVHDLEKIVARREICLFEHEHSIYLTSLSFERLLDRAGFDLLSLEVVPEQVRRGNSLLVAATPKGSSLVPDAVIDHGDAARLEDWTTLSRFQTEVDASLARLAAHVRETGRVAGYGAGGRGVITLAAAGLDAGDVAYLCDGNSSFHGLLAPKTHVPIVPPEHAFADPVDEIVVFSFGYLREIERTLEPHTLAGGRIVSMLDLLADPVAA
jgi:SAM-dependent methyltransferase